MERDEAVSRATDYLSSKGGKNWKQGDELKRRTNENVGFMATAQAIADIYQRGLRPRDLDLQKIDFGVSYQNIRTQIEEMLDKRGAKDFDKKVDAEVKSQMEKAEEMLQEEKEKREKIQKKAEQEAQELIQKEGELYQARESAWTGYQLASLESRNWMNPILEMIEYARAILELDEKLEDNFEGKYTVLKKRAEQMREIAEQIEGLNFEASEIDQANVPSDDEETEEVEEPLDEVIARTLRETREIPTQDLIEQVKGQTVATEDEIEETLERMKTEGTIYEPAPGQINILDHQAGLFYDEKSSLSEELDEQGQVKMGEPFGNVTIQVVKNKEAEIDSIKKTTDVEDYVKDKIGSEATEHLLAIYIDGDNDVLGSQTLGKGGLSDVELNPRSIVQMGIMLNAQAVILAHNHPSGKAEFTDQDVSATLDLDQKLTEFDIDLADHIVVTTDKTQSMVMKGIL